MKLIKKKRSGTININDNTNNYNVVTLLLDTISQLQIT